MFDLDNTLLDFTKAEKLSFVRIIHKFEQLQKLCKKADE